MNNSAIRNINLPFRTQTSVAHLSCNTFKNNLNLNCVTGFGLYFNASKEVHACIGFISSDRLAQIRYLQNLRFVLERINLFLKKFKMCLLFS